MASQTPASGLLHCFGMSSRPMIFPEQADHGLAVGDTSSYRHSQGFFQGNANHFNFFIVFRICIPLNQPSGKKEMNLFVEDAG